MKRNLFAFLFSTALLNATAQVIVKPQLASAGLNLKSQLWNIALINTNNDTRVVQVELILTDAITNQKILSGSSRLIDLPKGLLQVTSTKAAPILYNILSPDFNTDNNQEGFLPVGTYQICYTVTGQTHGEIVEQLAEECETITIEPISPPLLQSPADSETVASFQPLFTWLPPAPFSLFRGLSYDFQLKEVQLLQTGYDAIQQNQPVYQQQNISSSNLQYTTSLPTLQPDKVYAWQITAKSRGTVVAKSEVWTFKFPNHNQPTTVGMDYYAKVSQVLDGSSVICSGFLKYAYFNEANDKNIVLKIYDASSARQQSAPLFTTSEDVQYGQNFKQLDVSKEGLIDKHFYVLQLQNSRNEQWFLKFQFRK